MSSSTTGPSVNTQCTCVQAPNTVCAVHHPGQMPRPNFLLNDRGQELVAFVQEMLHNVENGDELAERIVLALGAKGWLR